MRRWIGLSIGMVFVIGVVAVFISSPWLSWHLLGGETKVIITDETVSSKLAQQPEMRELLRRPDHVIFVDGIIQRIEYNIRHWSWSKSWAALKTIALSPVPIQPALIAQFRVANESVFMTGVRDNNALNLVTSSSLDQLGQAPFIISINNDELSQSSDVIKIDVPGVALDFLPMNVRNEWNKKLLAVLHFNNTKPDIMGELDKHGQVIIRIDGDGAAIGIEGTDEEKASFTKKIRSWLQDEERYGRPVRRAFKLPDGTLGYELVPGEVKPVLQTDGDGKCLTPLDDKSALWVCGGIAGTSHQVTQNMVRQLDWQVQLKGKSIDYLSGINMILAGGIKNRSRTVILLDN